MAIAFPASLKQCFLIEGYQQQQQPNVVRSDVDQGPAKIRRRYTKAINLVTSGLALSREETKIFRDWFNFDLKNGVERFVFPDVIDQLDHEYRFISPPVFTPINAEYFRVLMDLEMFDVSGGPQVPPGQTNQAPIALNHSVAIDQGTSAVIDTTSLLSDADGTVDFLTLHITTSPSSGSISIVGADITYTPLPGFMGLIVFGFKALDNLGEISNEGLVTVTVQDVQSDPLGDFDDDFDDDFF